MSDADTADQAPRDEEFGEDSIYASGVKRGMPIKYIVGFCVFLVLFGLGFALVLKRAVHRPPALSETDRAALEVRDHRLVHPHLGFSIAHPGGMFTESPETEAQIRKGFEADQSTRFHAYAESATGSLFFVVVSKRPDMNHADFKKMVEAVAQSFLQKVASRFEKGAEVEKDLDAVDWPHRRALVHATVGTEGHVRIGAWTDTFGTTTDYVVMAIAVTKGADSLRPIFATFRAK